MHSRAKTHGIEKREREKKCVRVMSTFWCADGTIARRFCEMCCVHHYNFRVWLIHRIPPMRITYKWIHLQMQKTTLTHAHTDSGKKLTIQINETKHRRYFSFSFCLAKSILAVWPSIEEFCIEINKATNYTSGACSHLTYNQNWMQ